MSAAKERRERERTQRHQLIIASARELAETEGWEAVTMRRLADIVEYSQPVLYGHFSGKDAIIRAVAVDGFDELFRRLRHARLAVPQQQAPLAVGNAYLEFATERPALYEAMFVMSIDVKFAHAETPPPLRAGFNEFVSCLHPDTPRRPLVAEVMWSALHGLSTLASTGRIPPAGQAERLDFLITQLTNPTGESVT
ncbi:TetR family transcriptional regulator [Stackebrandtia endophytica]|uniref:TetR family transcriptional regulator n=1 Tax=Stackebrandtia endophytica TaxID=1496996 RepID=A0A543B2G9_9ACTN|nr:TetR/AcrR family transcriptional regulator [Stackebrandtia endophytica]TQL79006.1 TetR family transcriptional regulator [Stackebrandtia endophytica]